MINSDAHHRYKSTSVPFISKTGVVCVMFFVLFSLVGRFLLPFGDEPDFPVRSADVLYGDHDWWSPYSVMNKSFLQLRINGICKIQSSPLSLWAKIPTSCREDLEQIIDRFLLNLIICTPLFFIVIFKRPVIRLLKFGAKKISPQEWSVRIDILALTLLMPSMIYSLGFLAVEQLVVLLSVMLFVFLPNFFATGIILFLIGTLDKGNAIVVVAAVCAFAANTWIARNFGFRSLLYFLFAQLAFAFGAGIVFVQYLSAIDSLADKAIPIYNAVTSGEQAEKYPIILRPVVTFMTAIFMTSESVKVVPVYLVFLWAFIKMIQKFLNDIKVNIVDLRTSGGRLLFDRAIFLLTPTYVILFFLFLLPTYSNAKYYLFLLPFYVAVAHYYFGFSRIIAFLVLSNFCVYVFMILFYL